MLERLVEFVLAAKLSSVIEGFDRDSFSVSLWQGKIVMQGVRLSPQLGRWLGVPLEIKEGVVDRLEIVIPWRALATKAVKVSIEGVSLLLKTIPRTAWSFDEAELTSSLREAVNFEDGRLHIKQSSKPDAQSSTSAGLSEKILRNLSITIHSVHVRIETTDLPSALGLVCESLLVKTSVDVPADVYISKHLSVRVLYFYLQPDTKHMITRSREMLEEMQDLTCKFLCGEEHSSVVCPLSMDAELNGKREEETIYALKVTTKDIDLRLTQSQYQCLHRLLDLFSAFSAYHTKATVTAVDRHRAYLEAHPCELPLKQVFKQSRLLLKSGTLSPSDQCLYDAIIATTSEGVIYDWLLELYGEANAHKKWTRVAWVTSWFTGNRGAAAPLTPRSKALQSSGFDVDVDLGHIRVTLEGKRTTCSELVYRVQLDIERVGVVAASHRMALRVESCYLQFQDPVSLEYIRLFQFTSRDAVLAKGEDQLFLTVTQSAGLCTKTAVSLEIEPCCILFSPNVTSQIQSFFTVSAAVASSGPLLPQLQSLWNSIELDIDCAPCDIVLLVDETNPAEHVLVSLGKVNLKKIATVSLYHDTVLSKEESLALRVEKCSWILVSASSPPTALFSILEEVLFELEVDQGDFSAVSLTAALPNIDILLSKSTFQRLTDLSAKICEVSSTDAPFVDVRKKEIMSKSHTDKMFDIVWRHCKQEWQKLFTVWNNGYLYFFAAAEDLTATMYFSVNECLIRDPMTDCIIHDPESLEPFDEPLQYQILIVSPLSERSCRLGFESHQKCQEWVCRLLHSRHRPTLLPPVQSFGFSAFALKLTLASIVVTMETDDHKQIRAEVKQAGLDIQAKGTRYDLRVECSLGLTVHSGKESKQFREVLGPIDELTCTAVLEQGESVVLRYSVEAKTVKIGWNHSAISSLLQFCARKPNLEPVPKPPKPSEILLLGSTKVDHIIATLNNDVEGFTFADIALSRLSISTTDTDLTVDIGSVQVYDLSNYPESVLLTPETLARPFLLLSVSRAIALRVSTTGLSASIGDVEVTYLQQPLLRVINCLLYHIPAVLSQ